MNFARKRIRGQDGKIKRTWMDDSGNYRVTWAREIHGIRTESPTIHASVLTQWGWGFAGRRGPYKTVKAAKEACEFNKGLWDKFLLIEGRTKVTQVRDLRDRSWIGLGKSAVSAMSDIPSWVVESADPRLMEILCPTGKPKGDDECDYQNDPMPALTSIDADTGTTTESKDGPASDASDVEPASSRKTVAAESELKSAPPAKVRGGAPAKRSTKPTKRQSKNGGGKVKRSTSTTKSSKPSRRKKSKSSSDTE